MNKNAFKYSSVSKAVQITTASKGVVVVLAKKSVSSKKPAASKVTVVLNKSVQKSSKSVANMVRGYRADLVKPCLERVARIYASQKPVKPLIPKKVRGIQKK